MEVAAVSGIEQLRFALLADGDVRRNVDLAARLLALHDGKSIEDRRLWCRFFIDLQDRGPARRFFIEQGPKTVDPVRRPLGVDLHIGALVADTAADPRRLGMPVHRRPEADALHDPIYAKT